MNNNKHLVFGIHAVQSLLMRHPERIAQLCLVQERQDRKLEAILRLAKEKRVPIQASSKQELDRLTQEANHQSVVAICIKTSTHTEEDLFALLDSLTEAPFLLILDGVQDPHNLGACLRSADAAGIHAVIAPRDKAVGITPVVSKVACGAAESVPFIQVTNLARTLEALKERGIWLYGAAAEAKQSLYQTKLTGAAAIVLGGEGEGLRRLTREHCDVLLHIPMQGTVASLNVSVATGIFLFEAVRQRG